MSHLMGHQSLLPRRNEKAKQRKLNCALHVWSLSDKKINQTGTSESEEAPQGLLKAKCVQNVQHDEASA